MSVCTDHRKTFLVDLLLWEMPAFYLSVQHFRLPRHLTHNGNRVENYSKTVSSLVSLHALLKEVKDIEKGPGVKKQSLLGQCNPV